MVSSDDIPYNPTQERSPHQQHHEMPGDDVHSDHAPEIPTRRVLREAMAEETEKAKVALPTCRGRIDMAVKLVLAGDVELLDDGTAKVGSQSTDSTAYGSLGKRSGLDI